MANLLHASRLRTFGIHNFGGRNYDYTETYSPDKPGEEANENARVWNVYLDEAESHDADMIEGYRSILESLLVFAALFSAIVTAFVVQTSQALQPDNAQITVSLLFETNQLLRAAGNRTNINAVPEASLGPQSRTHTSKDVWVNGLFFTSLALSLSTALLSVLAKQWIQAYTAIVPGGAKTRALVRQFRFDGLVKYKLGDIIQSLPLILHCSVAIFLVGLVLYVSQLSRPISITIGVITGLTFLFYFGSSMVPALDIACPYRVPFMFYITEFLWYALGIIAYPCQYLWHKLTPSLKPWAPWQPQCTSSLRKAEHYKVFEQLPDFPDYLAHDSFAWIFNHSSSNYSVKQVVIEGTGGLLDGLSFFTYFPTQYLSGNSYFLSAVNYQISRLQETYSASSMEDEIGEIRYRKPIETFMKTFNLRTLLDKRTAGFNDWQEQIKAALLEAYKVALRARRRDLSQWLLDLGGPDLFQSGSQWSAESLFSCAIAGDGEDFRELVHRGIDLNCRDYCGWTVLHIAANAGNMDVAIAIVEQEPALISVQARSGFTALDYAIQSFNNSPMMVTCLLDHGAQLLYHDALYRALTDYGPYVNLEKVKLCLDYGWDRTAEDAEGKTFLEFASSKDNVILVEYLEHYQTVRLAPYGMTSHCE